MLGWVLEALAATAAIELQPGTLGKIQDSTPGTGEQLGGDSLESNGSGRERRFSVPEILALTAVWPGRATRQAGTAPCC